jgi:hypothetical protein
MGIKEHTNVKGFMRLVSLINKLNKPLSSSTLDKLSSLGALPNVEFEVPILNKNVNLRGFAHRNEYQGLLQVKFIYIFLKNSKRFAARGASDESSPLRGGGPILWEILLKIILYGNFSR